MKIGRTKAIFLIICTLTFVLGVSGQSRRASRGSDSASTVLTVTASRDDKKSEPIKISNLYLYENGFEQRIQNFMIDPSPSRILILVDNSQTLQTSIEKMQKAAMEFAYEIFDGDQLFTIAYDEKAEIIQEWTDDPKKMDAAFSTFRKKGNPYLFDALNVAFKEVLLPLMPGTRKTAVVIISDGLDRGSKISFENILAEMQLQNVTIYGLQLPDRTGGAYRRDKPKADTVMERLAAETGGKVFPFDEAQSAAKSICDELRKNRYLLAYSPTNTAFYDARRLFLIADEGISVRLKLFQPPNVK
ncbi:MAG: VWA domain-containing protein [Pyrinomonadaceae bacterium]